MRSLHVESGGFADCCASKNNIKQALDLHLYDDGRRMVKGISEIHKDMKVLTVYE